MTDFISTFVTSNRKVQELQKLVTCWISYQVLYFSSLFFVSNEQCIKHLTIS